MRLRPLLLFSVVGCLTPMRSFSPPSRAACRKLRARCATCRDLGLELEWCARVVREAGSLLLGEDKVSAMQLLDFEMSQERLGMGPASAQVVSRTANFSCFMR